MMLCRQSSQCGQARLAELDQHCQVGLLPGVVFRDVMPAHAGYRDALRRTWKAARAGWRLALPALHLEMQMGVLRLENAHQLRATMDWVRAEVVRTRRIAPIGATLSDQKIALNADFYVSVLAANTENT